MSTSLEQVESELARRKQLTAVDAELGSRSPNEASNNTQPEDALTKLRNFSEGLKGLTRTNTIGQMPEFDLPFEFSGRQAKTALGLMTTFDDEREVSVLRQNYPDLKFMLDQEENVIVDGSAYGGNVGYLNAPGLSFRDILDAGFQIAAFTPAGKAIPAMMGTAGKMMTVGGAAGATQAGLDLTNQATGGTEEVSLGNIDKSDVALVAGGGALFEGLGRIVAPYIPKLKALWSKSEGKAQPYIKQEFRRIVQEAGGDPESVTDDLVNSWIRASDEAVDPNSVPGIRDSKEFGIQYTRGQASGDLKQLSIEDSMRYGAMGDKAQSTMKGFADDVQNPSIQSATGTTRNSIAGGESVIDQVSDMGGIVRDSIKGKAATLDDSISQAYDNIGDAYLNIDGMKGLMKSITKESRNVSFIKDPQLAPATANALKEVRQFSGLLDKMGDQLKPFHIERIEAMRRKMNAYINSASNPNDKRQVLNLKKAFDRYMDDAVDNALFSGDHGALESMKNARSLRARYADKFSRVDTRTRTGRNIKDDAGDVIERMISANPTDEQVANYFFGASKIGSKPGAQKLAAKVKDILGPDSKEWSAIREAAFLKLTQGARDADTISGTMFAKKLSEAMRDSPTIMKTLFKPKEMAMMARLASAIKRAQPDIQNPSRTAYKTASIVQQTWSTLAQTIGFSQGGVGGAMVARGAVEGGKVVSGFRGASKAKDAVSGPVRPLAHLTTGNLGAVSANAIAE